MASHERRMQKWLRRCVSSFRVTSETLVFVLPVPVQLLETRVPTRVLVHHKKKSYTTGYNRKKQPLLCRSLLLDSGI